VENEERWVDGMDVHHLALHSAALLRRRLRTHFLLETFSFFALTLFARFFFSRTLVSFRPHSWRSWRRAFENGSRSAGRSRTRNVATASLHASLVERRETRFTPSFVKRSTAISRNSDVSFCLLRYAEPPRTIPTSRATVFAFLCGRVNG